MSVSRFMRVFSSGLLLLLATDGATDDSTSACSSELIACRNDETCVSCFSTATENGEGVSDCNEELGLDEIAVSALTCSDYMNAVCCHDQVSEEECLENSAYEEYWLCALEEDVGCMHDEITCSGASPSIGGAWTGVAVVGSTVALLPLLLWV